MALAGTAWISGCIWTSGTGPSTQPIPAGPPDQIRETLVIPNGTVGKGALSINIDTVDGSTRTIQFLPRAATFSDIKSVKFEILNPDTEESRFSAISNTVKSSYVLSNLAAPDTVKLRITTYASEDAQGTILNADGTGTVTGPISIVDQTVSSVSMSLALLDGYKPNGDLAATISISPGSTLDLPPMTVN